MAKLLQLRRGTTSQHSSFTGAEGEVTVDTDKDTIVVHDNSTAGGKPLATEVELDSVSARAISPNFNATASGSLSNGDTVIVNSDGTVSAVAGTTEALPDGIEYDINSIISNYNAIAFDPNNPSKFVMAWRKNVSSSYTGEAIVGTISGTTISFGSEYEFDSGNPQTAGQSYAIEFDPINSGKFIISYKDTNNSSKGTIIVGTVSGTTISFGSKYVYSPGNILEQDISFDPNRSGIFVISFSDATSSTPGYGCAIIGTISGTTISFGSTYIHLHGVVEASSVCYDPNNAGKFVIAYSFRDYPHGVGNVGTVTGTVISFGGYRVFGASNTITYTSITFDPNNAGKFVVVYRNNGNSNYGTAVVGQVSSSGTGTNITYGSLYVYNSATTQLTRAMFAPASIAGTFVVAYQDDGNSSNVTAIVGTVSGTTISFGSEGVFSTGTGSMIGIDFVKDSSGKFVVIYTVSEDSYPSARVGAVETTNLTGENFVGIADGAYTNGTSAAIQGKGMVDDAQSSLTAGQRYYIQEADGSLGTSAGDPSVIAGIALSSTKLRIE